MVDALKLQNITLGGHSTGGAVAIRYVARHNGYGVSKLALSNNISFQGIEQKHPVCES